MRIKEKTATLFVIGVTQTAVFALDLTPHQIVPEANRPPTQRYYFMDETRQLSFKIDNNMTVTGTNNAAKFSFKDVATASMWLSKSPLPPDLELNDKSADTYRAAARSLIPSQANDIQLEEENSTAIAINGWTTRQYKFFYSMSGVHYCRAITFLSIGPQKQLVFDVSAATDAFAKVYARSYRVINSIGDVPASAQNGPT